MKWGIMAMPSRMSLFNKEIILQIGRSAGWISIVYFLGLLFLLPIRMLMIYSDQNHVMNYQHFKNLFKYNFEFQVGLIIIVPVMLAVFLFRYIQVKQSADLMHSLPIKRGSLFHHYALTGILFLILPIILVALIILLMHSTLNISGWFTPKDVWYWAGSTTVITLLLFTASVFVAMMTGISALQAVLSYVFLFFPVGMTLLICHNLKILLFGFPSDYFLSQQLETMSPITYATVLESRILNWGYAILYMVLAAVLYSLSLLFYKKRRLEAASEAIAFPKLRSIFKYGTAFCTMLLGGAYFNNISFNHFGWTLFGYAVGAAFGYFVAEMVLQKTWRVFGEIKGLLIFAGSTALLVLGVQTLGIYENKIPAGLEIKNVLMSENINVYNGNAFDHVFTPIPMKEQGNIKSVIKFHKQIIADRNINQGKQSNFTRNLYFIYELKNGHRLIREYPVNDQLYTDLLKPIHESKEYKVTTNQIFHFDETKIKSINITPNAPENKMVNLYESKDIKEVLAALKNDLLEEKYEDSLYYENSGPMIQINIGREKFMNVDYRPNYKHLNEWLKRKNLFNRALITADDLSRVRIAKVDSPDLYDSEKMRNDVENSNQSVNITDKDQMMELLMSSSTNPRYEYKVIFYFKNQNYSDVRFIDEDHLPEFLKQSLK
jgi:ABC-2 type transport system permease protein